jgi:hypothetical protein
MLRRKAILAATLATLLVPAFAYADGIQPQPGGTTTKPSGNPTGTPGVGNNGGRGKPGTQIGGSGSGPQTPGTTPGTGTPGGPFTPGVDGPAGPHNPGVGGGTGSGPFNGGDHRPGSGGGGGFFGFLSKAWDIFSQGMSTFANFTWAVNGFHDIWNWIHPAQAAVATMPVTGPGSNMGANGGRNDVTTPGQPGTPITVSLANDQPRRVIDPTRPGAGEMLGVNGPNGAPNGPTVRRSTFLAK